MHNLLKQSIEYIRFNPLYGKLYSQKTNRLKKYEMLFKVNMNILNRK